MNRIIIEPQNEPHGEGNGWHTCPRDEGKIFVVYEEQENWLTLWVAEFYTLADACAFYPGADIVEAE